MFGNTYSAKAAEIEKKWVLIDAKGLVVGRLASIIALRLRGKHKPDQKIYYHHTGFPGGIKERSAKFILDGRFPERIVEKAVQRMLPRGPLGSKQLGNLRVYKGAEHPHQAQNPSVLDVAALNSKNVRND
jgi:large subunit ribosomal protein L13